jgi:tetratricopeptide (TPR) repeat protein
LARARWHEAERAHGPDSPEAGKELLELVAVLQFSHDEHLAEGPGLARRAVAILESAPAPDPMEVAESLEALAMWLWYTENYEEERPIVERALSMRERAVPPDESGIARGFHLLSELYRVEGDYGRALQFREREGPIVEHLFPDSPVLAVHFYYLAVIQKLIGDRDAAVASALRAVGIREKLPQPDPDLARSLNLLGGLLVDAGEWNRAEPVLERARTIWEQSGSVDQVDTALALTNLGKSFAARHEDDRAATVFDRVVRIRSAGFRPDHPLVADALTQLGAAQRRLGLRAAARSSLGRALEISEKRGLPSYPEKAAPLLEQALLDRDEGRLDAALQEALGAERLTREHFRMSSLGLSEREALRKARSRVGGLDLAWEAASELQSRGALDENLASAVLDESIRSRSLVLDTLATRQRILALRTTRPRRRSSLSAGPGGAHAPLDGRVPRAV